MEEVALPLILLAAVVQGWVLYGLHHAITCHHWPASDPRWLIALYALAVFIPATLQMLAQHARSAAFWWLAALLAVAYFYFGWHQGAWVSLGTLQPLGSVQTYFPLALSLTVLWLLVLPFAQCRLGTGSWTIQYRSLFTNAWRNKLMLAEASLFTGLFWLLLFLWQTLFHMLRIDYFRELFDEPVFIYPVTSLAFGCALHLIGSIERLTSVVLEQILSVLKWLAILAGVILVFFTVALVFKLPGLLFTGDRAIGATWLLWLIAVVVLLLNAAYRDGSVAYPYPKWVGQFLRGMVPLTVVISVTALYALMIRTHHYGLTVERVWAFVVAGAALCYSTGYSVSIFGRNAWLAGIARVNVIVALGLIAVICASLTPLLSPYRLAANSLFSLIREKGVGVPEGSVRGPYSYRQNTPVHYLRFDAGGYGRVKLQALAQIPSGPHADEIRRAAKSALAQTTPWEAVPRADLAGEIAKLRIYPAGRDLDRGLADALLVDLGKPTTVFAFHNLADGAAGLYIDLNGDGSEEFVILSIYSGLVYENRAGHWQLAGHVFPRFGNLPKTEFARGIIGELAKGNVSAAAPKWNDLSIGGRRFSVNPSE